MSWKDLAQGNPKLAEFGRERFATEVAYLATVRQDGSPRLHPVTPIIGQSHLFVFMEPTSPKGHDLRRDGRYAMHASVEDSAGGRGEFLVSGRGHFVDDPALRSLAVQSANYTPAERYILFEFTVDSALATSYEDGKSVYVRWQK